MSAKPNYKRVNQNDYTANHMETKTVAGEMDKEVRIFSVRVPEDLVKLLEKMAEREIRSLNGQIIKIIQQAVEADRITKR